MLAFVLKFQNLLLARLGRLKERHHHIVTIGLAALFALPCLLEYQILPLPVLDRTDAQVRVQVEQQHALARISRLHRQVRCPRQFCAFRHGGVQLVVWDQEILPGRGIIVGMPRIAAISRETHPVVQLFVASHIYPTPHAHFLGLHGVVAHFYPGLIGLQVRKEIGRAFPIGRHHTLEHPGQIFRADVFPLLLPLRVKFIRGPAIFPFHLFADFIQEPVRKAKGRLRERHVQLVLLGEQAELLSLGGIGRLDLKVSFPVKNGAKDHSICRLRKLDGPIDESDLRAVAYNLHVFYRRGLFGVHGRRRQGIPDATAV